MHFSSPSPEHDPSTQMSGNVTHQALRGESLNTRVLSGAGTVEQSRALVSAGS
jgi:hypothetical protein